jgi:predicted transcriptional regulator
LIISLSPERRAQLEDYAQRHNLDLIAALDEILGTYLEKEREHFLKRERQDFEETVASIQQGLEDVKAGRTRPIEEVLEELREKQGMAKG